MARKITGGLVGSPTALGSVQISTSAAISTGTNQNITLSPGGTGIVISTVDIQLNGQKDLRWSDSDDSNWVAFQAPAVIASNITWTLPATDGTAGQVLTTNAAGTLSWSSKSIAVSNEIASASLYYPLVTTTTSGDLSSANVSTTKITFQPSTGKLNLLGGQVSNSNSTGTLTVTGGVGVTGAMYVGGEIVAYAASDIRLKENLSKIDKSLEKLLKISGYQYHWNKIAQEMYPERTMLDVGVLAQEVKEIVPSAVVEREDGYLAVKYEKLIPLLVEAVKALKAEIEDMKREN